MNIRYCKGCEEDSEFWNVKASNILCIRCEKQKYLDGKVSKYSKDEIDKSIKWVSEMIEVDTKTLKTSQMLLYVFEMCQVYCVLSNDSREFDSFSVKKQIKEQHRWLVNYKKNMNVCTDVETQKK